MLTDMDTAERPVVDYDRNPRTFDAMLEAAEAQERRREALGSLPVHECVVATIEAMTDMFRVIANLRERVEQLEQRQS